MRAKNQVKDLKIVLPIYVVDFVFDIWHFQYILLSIEAMAVINVVENSPYSLYLAKNIIRNKHLYTSSIITFKLPLNCEMRFFFI